MAGAGHERRREPVRSAAREYDASRRARRGDRSAPAPLGAGEGRRGFGRPALGRARHRQVAHRRDGPRPAQSDPREEPGALAAHAGICAGGEEKSSSLPRPSAISSTSTYGDAATLREAVMPAMQMVEDLYASPIKNIVCRECAPGQDRAERKLVQKEQKSSELDRESDI